MTNELSYTSPLKTYHIILKNGREYTISCSKISQDNKTLIFTLVTTKQSLDFAFISLKKIKKITEQHNIQKKLYIQTIEEKFLHLLQEEKIVKNKVKFYRLESFIDENKNINYTFPIETIPKTETTRFPVLITEKYENPIKKNNLLEEIHYLITKPSNLRNKALNKKYYFDAEIKIKESAKGNKIVLTLDEGETITFYDVNLIKSDNKLFVCLMNSSPTCPVFITSLEEVKNISIEETPSLFKGEESFEMTSHDWIRFGRNSLLYQDMFSTTDAFFRKPKRTVNLIPNPKNERIYAEYLVKNITEKLRKKNLILLQDIFINKTYDSLEE